MRSIVITGAASGIGRATAKRLVESGWQVGLFDVSDEALQALEQELGAQSKGFIVDVTDPQVFGDALQQFVDSCGQLDALINCAGILSIGDFESIDLARHHAMIDINTKGVVNGCYLALPYLKAQQNSHVINLSSASATFGVPGFASYSASKFFVRGLTEALNIEWQRFGIHVCDIMPPFVNTPMVGQLPQSPLVDQLGVNLEADDIARKIEQALASERIHYPVSLKFRCLRLLTQCVPDRLVSTLYRKLAEY